VERNAFRSGGFRLRESSSSIAARRFAPTHIRHREDKKGRFWITTSNHVLQVRRDKLLAGKAGTGDIREYGPVDGLPSSEESTEAGR
jgi:hypothetical protein